MAREPAHAQRETAQQDSEQKAKQGKPEQDKPKGQVTAGGVRAADDRFRFEKHALKPGKGAKPPQQPFTRPSGSQPMNVDVKTGALTGAPHPEPKPDLKQAYGR